jgi:hypothetical protein
MASYARVAANPNSFRDRVVEFRVSMNNKLAGQYKYMNERAREIVEKINEKVGRGKLENLTYHKDGRWIAVFHSINDAYIITRNEIAVTECKMPVFFTKREEFGFLITIKCDPTILDNELSEKLLPYVDNILSIKHTTYEFDKTIEDGRRLFRVKLKVMVKDVPHQIEINGAKILLHFAGKEYFCKQCGNMHVPGDRCVVSPQSVSTKMTEKTEDKKQTTFQFMNKSDTSVDALAKNTEKQTTFKFTAPTPFSSNTVLTRGEVNNYVYTKNKTNSIDILDKQSLALPWEVKNKIIETQKEYKTAFDEARKLEREKSSYEPVENLFIIEKPFTEVKSKTKKKKERKTLSKKKEDGEVSSDNESENNAEVTMVENEDKSKTLKRVPIITRGEEKRKKDFDQNGIPE